MAWNLQCLLIMYWCSVKSFCSVKFLYLFRDFAYHSPLPKTIQQGWYMPMLVTKRSLPSQWNCTDYLGKVSGTVMSRLNTMPLTHQGSRDHNQPAGCYDAMLLNVYVIAYMLRCVLDSRISLGNWVLQMGKSYSISNCYKRITLNIKKWALDIEKW